MRVWNTLSQTRRGLGFSCAGRARSCCCCSWKQLQSTEARALRTASQLGCSADCRQETLSRSAKPRNQQAGEEPVGAASVLTWCLWGPMSHQQQLTRVSWGAPSPAPCLSAEPPSVFASALAASQHEHINKENFSFSHCLGIS